MTTPLTVRELTGQSVPDLNIPNDPSNRTTNSSGSDQRFSGFAKWDSLEAQVRETFSSQDLRYVFSKLQIPLCIFVALPKVVKHCFLKWRDTYSTSRYVLVGEWIPEFYLSNDTDINLEDIDRDTVIAYRVPTAFATEQLPCTTEHSVVSRFNHNIGHFMTCVGRDLGMRLSFADWVSCFVIWCVVDLRVYTLSRLSPEITLTDSSHYYSIYLEEAENQMLRSVSTIHQP